MIIYGKQLFLHLLEKHKEKIIKIYLAKECEKPLFSKIAKLGVKIERPDTKKAQALARGGNHQGFLAEVEPFVFGNLNELKKENFIVILYGLSDVGNIGAIVRTAHALGASGVIVVAKSLAMEGIIRTSSGAAYEIPICMVEDGLSLLNELKQVGFSVYGTASSGKNLSGFKFKPKVALVMGSEGDGMPKKAYEKCDECVGIKMKNSWDSLNVSAAFAIICDRIVNG
ncbi:23S rRNA (guanosine(2251)-2'-O)-methyltransferase RlmB [Campylobacter geochelonis]|uniref:23S rRNA (guanosine(2251)-2'-O)-methyltransferase RlmB n=1 Tax=Campylobacter geochelonis TaxID=1780362 RepID=UPI000770A1C0|nr:23S rRNA (guanosine(2251)-2'-O)-methyltransferase RlmB [Campylobacter geochelonis]CZE46606.1 RNA methyltransferase [Campylobacter geochelonis]CZE50395.1 RNA methyltransferase [Campylobacter geochelonis]